MNNIFKNAYFGKPYRTRGDRKALYIGEISRDITDNPHKLILSEIEDIFVMDDGRLSYLKDDNYDIVSEWQISEEEINRLAYTFANNNELLDNFHISDNADVDDLAIAYKVGFNKALVYVGSKG